MQASTKLSNAVTTLCYLAQSHPCPRTSHQIADHTGIHASRVRWLLSRLARIRIIQARRGSHGGFQLNRSPDRIHLQEVYCAIEHRRAFDLQEAGDSQNRCFGIPVNHFFHRLFHDIQMDIEEKMKRISLQTIINSIRETGLPDSLQESNQ